MRTVTLLKELAALAILAVGMWAGATCANWQHDDADAALLQQYQQQVLINDSTAVVLAQERADKTALAGLYTAERQLHGKVVAALKVRLELAQAAGQAVATEDTTFQDTVPALELHRWVFIDTVPRGVFNGVLEERVYPAPPALTWSFQPVPVEPSVAFVKYLNRYLAVVTCEDCKAITVEAPFVDGSVLKPKEKRLVRTIGAQYNILDPSWTGRAAVDLRLFRGLNIGVEGRQTLRFNSAPQLLGGVSIRF